MKIGIVGYGIVGKATHQGLINDDCDVVCHDPVLETKKEILYDCDIVFICVPTDNYDHVQNVYRICEYLHNNSDCEIVIRCTVPPGTTADINKKFNSKVMFMPEFLRERHWMKDCSRTVVLLGNDFDNKKVRFLKPSLITVSSQEAELVKIMNNVYATVNIAFANHIYDWCNPLNTDYSKVKDLFLMFRNGQDYLECNENLRGFGGKCLPPNLDFVITELKKHNIDEEFFSAIKNDNTKWPTSLRND